MPLRIGVEALVRLAQVDEEADLEPLDRGAGSP